MDKVTSNPLGRVVIFDAKKRGRPKKEKDDSDQSLSWPSPLKDELSDYTLSLTMAKESAAGAADGSPAAKKKKPSSKKNARKPKEPKESVIDKSDGAELARMSSWMQKYQDAPATDESSDWVPAYKFCKLYSCFWCQAFSWDLKRCSNCKRIVPSGALFLTVENSETFEDSVDKDRPFFHPPPVPYCKNGLAVFCTSCFYFSDVKGKCDNCGSKILFPSCQFQIDFLFEKGNEIEKRENSMVIDFVPRKIGTCFIECPHCFLSTKYDKDECSHCLQKIPVQVKITCPMNHKVRDKIYDLKWPLRDELFSGTVITLPPNYVPTFKENMLGTCPWCSTLVFDLHRCFNCLRQLPNVKNLVTQQPDSLYGISYGPSKPVYDPPPIPYYQPGKMSVCHECQNYSRNLRICNVCGEKQRNYVAVVVSFKNISHTQLSEKEKLVPFVPRKVNNKYLVCPQCELSTDKEKCIHCGLQIPSFVKITELSRAVARKGRNLQGKIILGHFKNLSLAREDSLINSGTITKRQLLQEALVLPPNYVPRYREKGIVQCKNCLVWSWDFDRCSGCGHKIDFEDALVIFPKTGFSHAALEDTRPKIHSTLPNLILGLVTFCEGCLNFVPGPPSCLLCGLQIDKSCSFFIIEAAQKSEVSSPNSKLIKFHPRTVSNPSMAFCVFCGFSSENNKTCSLCLKPFPSMCKVTPADGSTDELPPELDFVSMARREKANNKLKSQVEVAEPVEEDVGEAVLIKIYDWKKAVGFEEKNAAKEYLESIPFAVKLETVYDHQLSCFPDEIFHLPRRSIL